MKSHNWCAENGVEHAWQDGPVLCSNPPKPTRACANCGRREVFVPGQWRQYAAPTSPEKFAVGRNPLLS